MLALSLLISTIPHIILMTNRKYDLFREVTWAGEKFLLCLCINCFCSATGVCIYGMYLNGAGWVHFTMSMFLSTTGVYIYGLYLDGAGWDRRNCRLIEPTPKVLYTLLPVAHVFATNIDKPQKTSNLYSCPVYKKPKRTDLTYIFPLMLKTNKNPDHWILRGVGLLCDTK